ncbi:exopolysaccharide biosynthesis polyprenyl glycosylphosphotransferase [Falsiroseomonas oryziterrae]|uniref:exopolysaccharide biosynthesis polyprenyl glycosylphosphotransferase n=1 Tax=Falsiroseomonas oryziterrae TaxID=2911368 RepID=UPI001F0013EC|nr:exopolysaccharide biosynthesis polyprenyl glycosylphosphotransferase [Roseomonas sp. NPKOSM-4]
MAPPVAEPPSAGRPAEPFQVLAGADLAGVTPLRHGLADAGYAKIPANDAVRALPRPIAPWLVSALVLLLDLALIAVVGFVAAADFRADGSLAGRVVLLIGGLAAAIGLATGAYDHAILFNLRRQVARVLGAGAAAFAATLLAAFAFGVIDRLNPAWLAAFAALGMAAVVAGRALTAAMLQVSTRAVRRTVVVGSGPQVARLAAALRREPAGLHLIGMVEDRPDRGVRHADGLRPLGGMAQLTAMIRRGEVDVVAVALPWSAEDRLLELLDQLSTFPVEVRVVPDLVCNHLAAPDRPRLPPLVRARPISGPSAALKILSDYLLATTALLFAAIPMLLIAIAVKLDSPGPVFFRQRRTGFNDRPFEVLKFRTMFVEATDHEAARQVRPGDPRVTRIGAILRRTSLDELPQLFNVLRGEMSFVGPRPHAPGTRAGNRRFDEVVANYAARHRVKPGLTGLAQVRGHRGPTPTEQQILLRVESDLEYIANWSLWLDFVIVLRTLLIVVRMRNAH